MRHWLSVGIVKMVSECCSVIFIAVQDDRANVFVQRVNDIFGVVLDGVEEMLLL